MADIFTKEKRSWVMSRIRSKDTKPEKALCALLSAELYPRGYRYRRNHRIVSCGVRPDVVFVSRKVAIFVDGDFWHGYDFKNRKEKLPKEYWVEKIQNNMRRDRKHNRILKREGWTVIRVWEHQVRKDPERALRKVVEAVGEKDLPMGM